MVGAEEREQTLERIRELCLGLPETSERLSHGAPTFFVRGKRAFLMVLTDHHGDGRFAIWCAAPEGTQALLVEAEPERFFRPPYVGHRGWLGVRLDRGLDWNGSRESPRTRTPRWRPRSSSRPRARKRHATLLDDEGSLQSGWGVEEGSRAGGANLRAVKEQSQIDDMRAAVRGDRERAEQARQRSTENVRALLPEAAPTPAREPEPEPVTVPEPQRGLLRRLLGL